MGQELKRKIVHITMVVFALCIGRLPPFWISLLCLSAFFFNLFILPALTARGLERDIDGQRGFSLGMLMYPAILFILSLFFFEEQVFLALAWGAMAFGDGFAGFVGSRIGGPKVPWNPHKSWAGVIAFMAFGIPLTWGLLMLLPEESLLGYGSQRWLLIVAMAMPVAALMETVKGLIDDNLVVPTSAAIVAWFASGITGLPALPENWTLGLAAAVVFTVVSVASRKIDLIGGLAGFAIAIALFLGGGWMPLSLLLAFFVLGTLCSLWGIKEKASLGLAQENKSKRSMRHAFSNAGVAGFCALLAWFYPDRADLYLVLVAASLASAAADTAASELGNLYGKRYYNVLTLREDERGLDGVISMQGTLLGVLAACVIAAIYFIWTGSWMLSLAIVLAGALGNFFDSLLGASLQRRGYMTNDAVNFANTLFAALVVLPMINL